MTTGPSRLQWTRRRRIALILIGIILGSVAVPVLAAVFTNPVPQSGTVPYETNSGATINVVGTTNTTSGSPFPDDQTAEIVTEAGNATFSSTGNVNATVNVSDITGTWTTVSNLDVTAADLTINPEDKPRVTVGDDIDRIEFTAMQADDGNADFTYAGSTGSSSVTVRGMPADTQLQAVDVASGDVLETATADSNGVATFSVLPNSEHTVEIKSGTADPILSDPQPDGNVSSAPSEFSVLVEDDDFPGDTVTLEWYLDGSKFNTTSVSSDGRTSVPAPSLTAGESDWSVIATDENGNTAIINATVGTPGSISLRNESDASQLITETVVVTIYSGNESYIDEQTVSNGKVDMTGLPVTDFILSIDASDTNYTNRTVYYQNIVGNKSAYLLNTTANPSVEARFVLDDPTGEYGPDTVIYVKRAINKSGDLEYRTVHSDKFGVEGVIATLEEDVRYQIVIQNEEGTVQDLGPYRAELSETVTVRPGTPKIELADYSRGYAANATQTNGTLAYAYDDPDRTTQKLTVWIYEKGNRSNRLQPNATYFDLGSAAASLSLTQEESETTWIVAFIIEFDDGSSVTVTEQTSILPDILPPLDDVWLSIIGVGMMFISAGIFSQLNAGVGGVVVALEGGILWWLGFLSGVTSGAAVVMAIFIAVMGHIYSSRTP